MVLHYDGARGALRDFGILIPAAPDRPGRILAALRDDPAVPDESLWLLGPDGSEITREDIERVHAGRYVNDLFSDAIEQVVTSVFELVDPAGRYHRYDPAIATRPLAEMFAGTLRGLAGTCQAGREALRTGFCFYLGGGAHHAHADFGHGFCIVNDSVVAIRRLQADGTIRTAWVIDVDAHKGDGTASLTQGDETVRTLSVHMAHGWPLDLPRTTPDGSPHPSYVPSDFDVGIEPGAEDRYVPRLRDALEKLARFPRPDLAYVLAGADPYEHDELPSTAGLRLTLAQMYERDVLIHEVLARLGVPQAWLMAGGYGTRSWEPYPPFIAYALAQPR